MLHLVQILPSSLTLKLGGMDIKVPILFFILLSKRLSNIRFLEISPFWTRNNELHLRESNTAGACE